GGLRGRDVGAVVPSDPRRGAVPGAVRLRAGGRVAARTLDPAPAGASPGAADADVLPGGGAAPPGVPATGAVGVRRARGGADRALAPGRELRGDVPRRAGPGAADPGVRVPRM